MLAIAQYARCLSSDINSFITQVQQNIWASRLAPPADAPSPPADAIPEDPPAEASAPPPLNSDSDAEEGVNVDVNVKAPRGIFFVRLTLQVGLQGLIACSPMTGVQASRWCDCVLPKPPVSPAIQCLTYLVSS